MRILTFLLVFAACGAAVAQTTTTVGTGGSLQISPKSDFEQYLKIENTGSVSAYVGTSSNISQATNLDDPGTWNRITLAPGAVVTWRTQSAISAVTPGGTTTIVVTATNLTKMPPKDIINRGEAGQTRGTVALVHSGTSTSYSVAGPLDTDRGTALRTAAAAAVSGDTLVLTDGSYLLPNGTQLVLANGVNLAMSLGATILGTTDLAGTGCIVKPGTNSVISGGRIKAVGATTSFIAPIGLTADLGDTAKTGIVIQGVTIEGTSDGVYFQINGASCTVRDCDIVSNFDAVVAAPSGSSSSTTIDCYNCRVWCLGPNGSNTAHGVLSTFDSVIRYFGGSITVLNAGTTENDALKTASGGTIRAYGVQTTVANGANPKFDARNTSGTLQVDGECRGSGTNRAFSTTGTITSILPPYQAEGSVSLAASATTMAITTPVVYVTGDAGANTVATITGGVSGMRLTLIFADSFVTLTDTAAATANTMNLSAAFTSTANDTMTFVFSSVAGGKWLEVSRSVN